MQDEKGNTRRERNEDAERRGAPVPPTPPFEIPEAAEFFWNWYWEISRRLKRVEQGVAVPIDWVQLQAWQSLTQSNATPLEIEIISTMDDAFCEETNKELKAFGEREKERLAAEKK